MLQVGSRVESCSLPNYLQINVPQFLKAGYIIKTGNPACVHSMNTAVVLLRVKVSFLCLFSPFPTRGGTVVDLSLCDTKSTHLTLTDDSFTVTPRGEIVAARPVYVSASGRTFSVFAEDSGGLGSEMEVHLDCATQVIDS